MNWWTLRRRCVRGAGRTLPAAAADVDLRRAGELRFASRFHAYLGRVTRAIGAEPRDCAFELDDPATAYFALGRRLTRFPDHDLALIWSEVHGWAVALEDGDGVEHTVLAYLGTEVLPAPHAVAAFLTAVHAADAGAVLLHPPAFRRAGRHHELAALLPPAPARPRSAGAPAGTH